MAAREKNGYGASVDQLCNKFKGRGAAANAKAEADRQITSEREAPNAYFVARMDRGEISARFRTGEYNGKKYMTTGDFLEKYKTHRTEAGEMYVPHKPSVNTREFKKSRAQSPAPAMPRTEGTASAGVAERRAPASGAAAYATHSAHRAQRHDPHADTIIMPATKTTGKIKGRVAKLFATWFATDGEKRSNEPKKKKNVPVAMIGFLVSVAAAMSMIVGTTVMSSDSQSEVASLKSEIKALEAERLQLEEELVKKDDLVMISTYAEEKLGMIRMDYVSAVYLPARENDDVYAVTDDGGEGFASLLSAIYGG